ncbi:hypothetical protein DTO217A2_2211 [Paecilomyces variotii]|nr:hypothetical protein DTO217A2_2211 [Paecilomyces variotii]KAJ9402504.1 hypothetical protein DTO282F9_700 [Paecilomyces variotii]
MGNICSRSANKSDPFSQPGRVLGSAPPAASTPRAPLPPKVSSSMGPGRTLGGTNGGSSTEAEDPRSKAALAAQKRAEAQANAANKGKLGSQLAAQKAQTHSQTLVEASRTERAARDADNAAQAQRWE